MSLSDNELTPEQIIALKGGFDAWINKNRAELNHLKAHIENISNESEPSMIQSNIMQSLKWLARTVTLMAEARSLMSIAQGNFAAHVKDYAPSIAKLVIKKHTADIEKVVVFIDRANAMLTHGIEALRSVLSYQKNLMQVDRQTAPRRGPFRARTSSRIKSRRGVI